MNRAMMREEGGYKYKGRKGRRRYVRRGNVTYKSQKRGELHQEAKFEDAHHSATEIEAASRMNRRRATGQE
jgi:hypothetical protein